MSACKVSLKAEKQLLCFSPFIQISCQIYTAYHDFSLSHFCFENQRQRTVGKPIVDYTHYRYYINYINK